MELQCEDFRSRWFTMFILSSMYIVCIEYMFCTQEAEMCTDLYAKACIHEVYPWCMVCTIVVAVHLHSKGLCI